MPRTPWQGSMRPPTGKGGVQSRDKVTSKRNVWRVEVGVPEQLWGYESDYEFGANKQAV